MRELRARRDGPACLTGRFRERGIIALDGFAAEQFTERPENLIVIPPSLGRLACCRAGIGRLAKGLRQARMIGSRQRWEPRRAIVLGVGAIGMLTTYVLRLEGIETWAVARRPPPAGAHSSSKPWAPPTSRPARPRSRSSPERSVAPT